MSAVIFVGKNTRVWKLLLSCNPYLSKFVIAISHSELLSFSFPINSTVWIFSHARKKNHIYKLIKNLKNKKNVKEYIYVSSVVTNISKKYPLYSYPRTKRLAQAIAVQQLKANVVILGLVYNNIEELPYGVSYSTHCTEIINLLHKTSFPKKQILYKKTYRPFTSKIEQKVYKLYKALILTYPANYILLRPIDFILSKIGYKWYGYFFLSCNKLEENNK